MHLCILHQHHLHHIWEEVIQMKKVRALLATDKQQRYLSRNYPPGCKLMNAAEMQWLKMTHANISITCPDGAKDHPHQISHSPTLHKQAAVEKHLLLVPLQAHPCRYNHWQAGEKLCTGALTCSNMGWSYVALSTALVQDNHFPR